MVDDDPAMLEIAKIFLERSQDIRVDAIESAKEAMVKLKDGHYDVIVSDYVMPEMDGISFLKWVRRQDHDVPFILFTGKGREEVVIEASTTEPTTTSKKTQTPKSSTQNLPTRSGRRPNGRRPREPFWKARRSTRPSLRT